MRDKEQSQTNLFAIDEPTAKAIKDLARDDDSNEKDEHKFSILRRFFERENSPHLAELDKREILKMNDIESYTRLIPIVWRRRITIKNKDGVVLRYDIPPLLKSVIELYHEHCYDHRVNTSSKNRKRETATVHALRNDNSTITTDKQIASFIGRGR